MLKKGFKIAGNTFTLNLLFPDTKDKYVLALENGTMSHTPNTQFKDADATLTIPRAVLNNIVLGETTLDKAIESGKVTVRGKKEPLTELVSMLDTFDF